MNTCTYRLFRCILDRVGAAILFLLGLPLMAGIAIFIWVDDGTPILFRQLRAGKQGEPFVLLKFRSLESNIGLTTTPSSHTTRVGRFLRRWALDELPQLWNVLRGEMSLVGPRPVLLQEARGYDEETFRRLAVRPGITGWAQIHGRNSLSWTERIEHDLWYVNHRSFALDLKILLQTPSVLLLGEGVYGPGTNDPSSTEVETHLQKNHL